MPLETTKLCSTCKRHKPLDAFSKRPQGKQGRHSACRECNNERISKRRVQVRAKTCGKCGQHKPASEFPRNRASLTGLNHWCKACNNDRRSPLAPSGPPPGHCTSCGRPPSDCVFPVSNKQVPRVSSWCLDCHLAFRRTLTPEQAKREARHWQRIPSADDGESKAQTPGAKHCGVCRRTKPETEFAFARPGKPRRESWCRACRADYGRAWRQAQRAPITPAADPADKAPR